MFSWFPLYVHFRWGVTLVEIHLLGIAHLVVAKNFHALEVHPGMERIQDLSGEAKARFGFVLHFVNFGWKTQFCYVKRTEL